jgi:hypothetical protein
MTGKHSRKASRVVVISNPASGHNRKTFARLEKHIAGIPELEHHITRSAGHADRVIAEMRLNTPDVIVINGGDGTAAHLFGLVLRHWPAGERPLLMVLPGGTANMTAGDLGVAAQARLGRRRFLRWVARGCPLNIPRVECPVLRVEPYPGATSHFGMFLGTGAIMQGTRFAQSSLHARGFRGETSLGLTLFRTIWGLVRQDPEFFQGVSTRLALHGTQAGGDTLPAPIERADQELVVLAASTLKRLFLGIRPFWAPGPGPIGLTTVRFGAPRFLSTFISIIRGRPNRQALPSNGYDSFRADSFQFWQDGPFNLDGEVIEARRDRGPVTVTAEGPLRFLKPR